VSSHATTFPVFLSSAPESIGILQTPSITIGAPDYTCAVKIDRLNIQLKLARKNRLRDHQPDVVREMRTEPLEALPVRFASTAKPDVLIREAHKASMIPLSERCFFGGSNVCRYQWTPNKLYPVYVSPASKTKISLPPGERLAVALSLNGEVWDVGSARVGVEPTQQDHIFVRPISLETPSIDISLVTEAGHSFDVQLIVGKQGLFGVTWEVPPIVQVPGEEETPLFPRPVR
jgi:hypothetical protein